MNDIPEGYYRDDNGILKQIVINGDKISHAETIPLAVLAQLEGMDNAALIELIRRCCPDKARVLLMGEVEQAQAMLDVLAVMALTGDDDKSVLNAIREWLDRKQGKPLQRASLDVRSVSVQLRERTVRSEKIHRLLGLPLKS